MSGKLKARTTINCDTCGCKMIRVKTINVKAVTIEDAKIEANEKYTAWKNGLHGQSCKTCRSILSSL